MLCLNLLRATVLCLFHTMAAFGGIFTTDSAQCFGDEAPSLGWGRFDTYISTTFHKEMSMLPNHEMDTYSQIVYSPTDLVETRFFLAETGEMSDRRWEPAWSLAFWIGLQQECNPELRQNIYVGVLPRTEEYFGDKAHVRPGHAVWMDVDHAPPEAVQAALAAYNGPLRLSEPTLVISSGRGTHLYWRMSEPMAPSDIVTVNRAIVHHARTAMGLEGADMAATDAARVMRLPGTINHKCGHMCRIHAVNREATTHSPRWWLDWARQAAPPPVERPKPAVTVRRARTPAAGGMTGIVRAMAYVSKTPGVKEGERDNTAYRLACFCLHDCGVTEEGTVGILQAWDRRNLPPLVQKESELWVLRQITQNAITYGGQK